MSYSLKNICYGPCEGVGVEEIVDIGEVVSNEEAEEPGEEGQHLAEREIVAVLGVDEYPNSVSCKRKIKRCDGGTNVYYC